MGRHARADDAPVDPREGRESEGSVPASLIPEPRQADSSPAAGRRSASRQGRDGSAAVSVSELRSRLAAAAAGSDRAGTEPTGPYTGRRRAAVASTARTHRVRDAVESRTRLARLAPLAVAFLLIVLTAGVATATQIVFGSKSTNASAAGVDADPTSTTDADGDTDDEADTDNRVSRDDERTDVASPSPTTVPTPAPTPSMSIDPLAGLADPVLIEPTPTPTPEPPPVVAEPVPPAPVWVRPTDGGNMTSCFCNRWGTFHDGIDIDPPYGTPIYAVGDGEVVYAGPLSGYGIGIFIRHDNGDVSFYGHESIYYVKTGDIVTAGQKIALVGNEGFSTGPHLHFSVYQGWKGKGNNGTPIDPVPWLAERGVILGGYNPNG